MHRRLPTARWSQAFATYVEKAMKDKKQTQFPEGWDEAQVREVLDYYENQTEEEAIAEAEAAFESRSDTLMMIPNELVPVVRELIAKRRLAS